MALAMEVSRRALVGTDVETVLELLAAGAIILPVASEATVLEDTSSKCSSLSRTRNRGLFSDRASVFG